MDTTADAVAHALELCAISKAYGDRQVISSLTLTVRSGESLAVIGHNGAGKTTLMKLILGLTHPSNGTIHLWNTALTKRRAAAQYEPIGFLPETVAFNGGMTARHILNFYARLKNQPLTQCDELLELVGLSAVARHRVGTYSKGMRQRLGLAQALLGKPRLLLLDEPTTGMDPFLRRHFYSIIRDRQSEGTTILLASHALTEIEAQTDRVVILKKGRALMQGTLDELRCAAGLPSQISVVTQAQHADKLLQAVGPDARYKKVNESQIEFSCTEANKLTLLHRITQEQEYIEDVQMIAPRLEDLYTHFVNGADEQ
ncbi:MAG: ABC transporter ATP-binding protein [Pseudomonadales bacterium]